MRPQPTPYDKDPRIIGSRALLDVGGDQVDVEQAVPRRQHHFVEEVSDVLVYQVHGDDRVALPGLAAAVAESILGLSACYQLLHQLRGFLAPGRFPGQQEVVLDALTVHAEYSDLPPQQGGPQPAVHSHMLHGTGGSGGRPPVLSKYERAFQAARAGRQARRGT